MSIRRPLLGAGVLLATAGFGALGAAAGGGSCGPFTDVTGPLCPFVLTLYYQGITAGTSATTFSPSLPATRGEAAVFAAKGLDLSIRRSTDRAVRGEWWFPRTANAIRRTPLGSPAYGLAFDGADLWVGGEGVITRVRASDGRVLESWSGAHQFAGDTLVAGGHVYATGFDFPNGVGQGYLYRLDPRAPAGSVEVVANLPCCPGSVAFDGERFWVISNPSHLSIVTPTATLPWSVESRVTFVSGSGIVFDGTSMWATDLDANALIRFDEDGTPVGAVDFGTKPYGPPVFDGENLWVTLFTHVAVVRASTGEIVKRLDMGSTPPSALAFDGERVLVTGCTLSLWKATDLSPIGSLELEPGPCTFGAVSDGTNFWIAFRDTPELGRF